jgi:ankyrin repeat protein
MKSIDMSILWILGLFISVFFIYKKYTTETLFTLAKKGNLEELQKHLSINTQINKKNNEGDTALHIAILYGYLECVKLLVKYGANIHTINAQGETPLHLSEENVKICKFLLDNGANIHQKDYEKSTVLLNAASTPNNLEVLMLLISYGAEVNTQDAYGNTPQRQTY